MTTLLVQPPSLEPVIGAGEAKPLISHHGLTALYPDQTTTVPQFSIGTAS